MEEKIEDLKEEWRDVEGYEGSYQVSNLGRVRSLDRYIVYKSGQKVKYKGKLISQKIGKSGYCEVNFSINNKQHYKRVHRLVAENFIENKFDKKCVNHIDGDRLNNKINNLEWSSHKENTQHAIDHSLIESRIFSLEEIKIFRTLYLSGRSVNDIANKFEVNYHTMWNILKNRSYFNSEYQEKVDRREKRRNNRRSRRRRR